MPNDAWQQLPEPEGIAQAHSRALAQRLKPIIAGRGDKGYSFFEYMRFVLYEPAFGYYAVGNQKLGEQGDFVTSPELTPLFGYSVAEQVEEVLLTIGGNVLEFGAGTGALARSIFEAIGNRQVFNYLIIEPSSELQQRQQLFLKKHLQAAHFQRVQWLDTLPQAFTGIVLANEVLDAFPVERFVKDDSLLQCFVNQHLQPVYKTATQKLCHQVSVIEADLGRELPTGYQSEVSPLLLPWLRSIEQSIKQGVLLLFDYGYPRHEYYSEERSAGTLSCFYRHRVHEDPFFWPGLQDITAHVDYTTVAEATRNNALELLGYASQAAFLLDNQLLEMAEQVSAALPNELDRIMLSKSVQTLTLPGEMGERFQVMALGKHYDKPLRGFRTQDLTYRL